MSAAIFPASARRNTTSKLASSPHRKNSAPAKLDSHQQPDRSAERNNPVQQLIKQAVDSLVQQLEVGKSDALTAYLAAMARFHRYSLGNIMAIARACPAATRVAGYQTWKELGRQVKKGEKGIQIFAPMVLKQRRKDSDDLETEANPHSVLIGFRPVYVWERLSRDLRPGFSALDTTRKAPSGRLRWQPAISSLNLLPCATVDGVVISCHPFQNCGGHRSPAGVRRLVALPRFVRLVAMTPSIPPQCLE